MEELAPGGSMEPLGRHLGGWQVIRVAGSLEGSISISLFWQLKGEN